MHPLQVEKALDTMTILVDTREQPTVLAEARWRSFGRHRRQKLDFGDYSAEFALPDGSAFSLADRVVIERKMSFDELANCFCSQRDRFAREFERAAAAGAKIYLLVEDGSWEKAFGGVYRSRMSPQSLVASMCTWLARYRCQIIFCQARTTGRLAVKILRQEGREALLRLDK